jgi:hypothetical protein
MNAAIQQAAREAREGLQIITTREPEAPASALITKRDTCPGWVAQAIKDAHDLNDLMPDDLTYEMVADALAAIADNATDDADDDAHEYADSAPSLYTHDRAAYVANAQHRRDGAMEAIIVYNAGSIEDAAALAWYYEAREVYDVMRAAVEQSAGVNA